MKNVYFEIVGNEAKNRIKAQIRETTKENDRISELWTDFAKRCGSPKPYMLRRKLHPQGIKLVGIYFIEKPTGWQRVSANFYKPTYTYQRKLRKEFVGLPEMKYVADSFLPEYGNATHYYNHTVWFMGYDFIEGRYFVKFVADDKYYPQMQNDERLKELKEWQYLKIFDEANEEGSK